MLAFNQKKIDDFIEWFKIHITGYEKGESQIFFDRLLQAFGNPGVKEVGAKCEMLVKKGGKKFGFSDLVWDSRVIIELKKRGEPLQNHYNQAFEYWLNLVPHRPKYMVLCNFDEFWIYDLNNQLNDPVHKLKTIDLNLQWGALNFLFPKEESPIFDNNNVEVTEKTAKTIGLLYKSLVDRNLSREDAQKFIVQLTAALFAEDFNLIPKYTFKKILLDARDQPSTQKNLEDLFKSMSIKDVSKKPKKFDNIRYFNGSVFGEIVSVELNYKEFDLLVQASKENWSKIRPSIFGSIFENSLDSIERHEHGVHYTREIDINKVISPTIVKPFQKKIDLAKTTQELRSILHELHDFKILDPACGCGNFLYIAYSEILRMEFQILEKINNTTNKKSFKLGYSPKNLFGIDINKFGLEIAKFSISIGTIIVANELGLGFDLLPFENLDSNFINDDALLCKWPKANAIIGNPPYLSSKYLKVEYSIQYVDKIRKLFPEIPGRADYCVYWFRKTHDHLDPGQRAGLVGTNTIRQNYSREGGLDYIVNHNGTITEAVSSQVWSGEAKVHVSIVNWMKGKEEGKKKLYIQQGNRIDSPWDVILLNEIPATLSQNTEIGTANVLSCNRHPKKCFQGQSPASEGFYLSKDEYLNLLKEDKKNSEVLFPFLIGRELLSKDRHPKRYIIDFGQKSLIEAMKYTKPFKIIKSKVLPDIQCKLDKEIEKYGAPRDRGNQMKIWWKHWRNRADLIKEIEKLPRYIVISRVTKRPIFDFVSSKIHPGDALVAFTFADDYSFGILQSSCHCEWFKSQCSTLKRDLRYTGDTVYDTFPWPQNISISNIKKIALLSKELRDFRAKILNQEKSWGLKDLYNSLDLPGQNDLKTIHEKLDKAVIEAYGFDIKKDLLEQLLNLNLSISEKIEMGKPVISPGLNLDKKNLESYITYDCIELI